MRQQESGREGVRPCGLAVTHDRDHNIISVRLGGHRHIEVRHDPPGSGRRTDDGAEYV